VTQPVRLPTFKELLLAAAGAVVLAAAVYKAGPIVIVGLAALLLAILMLARPAFAAALAVSATVLCQADADWGLAATGHLYDVIPGMKITIAESLLLLAAAAAVIAATRRGRMLLPAPFTPALLLLATAIVFGAVMGISAGAGKEVFLQGRAFLPLLLVPFIIVNAVERNQLRTAIGLGAILAGILGVVGLAFYLSGKSAAGTSDGGHLTFLEAAPNFVMMLFLLCVFAAVLSGVKLPKWVIALTPFVFAALLFSYRRSFYIATVVGLLLILLLASGQVGRRILIPGLIVVALGGWFALSSGVVTDLNGPVEQRIQSLDPSKVKQNAQDRYRLDERRNVVAELKSAPLTGLGLGVPWRARYPLSIENKGGRGYAHFAALFYWLKLGPLGVLAYIWILGTVVVTGIGVWRRNQDSLIRVAALAFSISAVGLAIAELTATFVGADTRMATIIGALIGLLAIANAATPRSDRPV
jgi:hypothetical protein